MSETLEPDTTTTVAPGIGYVDGRDAELADLRAENARLREDLDSEWAAKEDMRDRVKAVEAAEAALAEQKHLVELADEALAIVGRERDGLKADRDRYRAQAEALVAYARHRDDCKGMWTLKGDDVVYQRPCSCGFAAYQAQAPAAEAPTEETT